MILDTSVIVAILRDEPGAERLSVLIEEAEVVSVSTATLLEAHLVLGAEFDDLLVDFMAAAQANTVAFDAGQLAVAVAAHRRFGRGSGSPARLNFGDCFSYALARTLGRQLLYLGNDFAATDVNDATPAG